MLFYCLLALTYLVARKAIILCVIHIHFIHPIQNGFIQCAVHSNTQKRKIDANRRRLTTDASDPNADASRDIVSLVGFSFFFFRKGIFAKQTNDGGGDIDVRIKIGYHLFIFHIFWMAWHKSRWEYTFLGEPFLEHRK